MEKSITDFSSVTIVSLDLAKLVFQVHGVDASGRVVVAKAVKRKNVAAFFAALPPCRVGLEACGSARQNHRDSRCDWMNAGGNVSGSRRH
jgi:transposase